MNKTQEIDNYKAVFEELIQDVITANKAQADSDSQFNRRVYIRTLFALVRRRNIQ